MASEPTVDVQRVRQMRAREIVGALDEADRIERLTGENLVSQHLRRRAQLDEEGLMTISVAGGRSPPAVVA